LEQRFWRTAVSDVQRNRIAIRGYPIQELIAHRTFGDVVHLVFTGELPEGNEGVMIEAILVAMVDHGLVAPSAAATYVAASAGIPLQAAIGAGILALGDYHGGAIEPCAKLIAQGLEDCADTGQMEEVARAIVAEAVSAGERIPGYGHRVHTDDPRAKELLRVASDLGVRGRATALALAIERVLQENSRLTLNIDGVIAALMLDMGFDWRLGKAFYIIARSVGLAAHAVDQMRQKPLNAPLPEDIEYTGPPERHLSRPPDVGRDVS